MRNRFAFCITERKIITFFYKLIVRISGNYFGNVSLNESCSFDDHFKIYLCVFGVGTARLADQVGNDHVFLLRFYHLFINL